MKEAVGVGDGFARAVCLFTGLYLSGGQLGIQESATVRFGNITPSPDAVACLFWAPMEIVDAPLKILSAELWDSRVIL